jgi:hypothetical protein
MCLLLNFIHELHQIDYLPRKDWFLRHSGCDLGMILSFPSFLEQILVDCLPLYLSITWAVVASGRTTSFWFDKWLPDQPCWALPRAALPLHLTAGPDGDGCGACPCALATTICCRCVGALARSPDHWQHHSAHRTRSSLHRLSLTPPFSSCEVYPLPSPTHLVDSDAYAAWALRLPTKMKIFSYLTSIGRLSTRVNLLFKGCAPSDVCDACMSTKIGRNLFFDWLLV